MEFKLNSSPHLKMHEITKKLFNRNFLSDIQFNVDGNIIYAHSLELMKRSVVFEQQLEGTLGDKKLIPITDCTYGSFLEFVRFIYTDECDINVQNGIELLKLATKYQVIMLESRVINSLRTSKFGIQLFEHCVTEKYDIARDLTHALFAWNFRNRLTNKEFSTLHPDAVLKALQFEAVEKGVSEKEIFNALVGWIENYCKYHNMSLSEGRHQFDCLIRQVRFPTMSNDELRESAKQYPELLNDRDFNSIARQIIFENTSASDSWIPKRRDVFQCPMSYKNVHRDKKFETKFCVRNETILQGIWIGVEKKKKDIEIEIWAKDNKKNEIEKINFIQSPAKYGTMIINLGHSMHLLPNIEYTIVVKYLEITEETKEVYCRNDNVELVNNDPENGIEAITASDNMLGIYFEAS